MSSRSSNHSQSSSSTLSNHSAGSGRGRRRSVTHRVFLLTGFTESEKKQLKEQIISLGAVVSETQEYTTKASHVVCKRPCRSEKFLGACAMGKWIMCPSYIQKSYHEGKWLPEEPHEWTRAKLPALAGSLDPENHYLLDTPRRCRLDLETTGVKIFAGWNVVLFLENKSPQNVYERLLRCGGARTSVPAELPSPDCQDFITHLFIDEKRAHLAREHRARGVLCLEAVYLGDYITMSPKPDVANYLLPNVPEVKVNVVNQDSRQPRRRSTSVNKLVKAATSTSPSSSVNSKESVFASKTPRSRSISSGSSKPTPSTSSQSSNQRTPSKTKTSPASSQSSTSRLKTPIKVEPDLPKKRRGRPKKSTVDLESQQRQAGFMQRWLSPTKAKSDQGTLAAVKQEKVQSKTNVAVKLEPGIAVCSPRKTRSGTLLKRQTPIRVSSKDDTKNVVPPKKQLKELRPVMTRVDSEDFDWSSSPRFKLHNSSTDSNCPSSSASSVNSESPIATRKILQSPLKEALSTIKTEAQSPSRSSAQTSKSDTSHVRPGTASRTDGMSLDTSNSQRGIKRKSADEIPLAGSIRMTKKQKFSKQIPWLPLCHLNKFLKSLSEEDKSKRVCLPLSVTSTNILESCFEEVSRLQPHRPVETLLSYVATNRYPTGETLALSYREGLLASRDSGLSQHYYTVLCKVADLHPPTSPALQNVYLSALRGRQADHTHSRREWAFLHQVISSCLSTDEDSRQTQQNNHLLLKYLVGVFQQDFNHHWESRLSGSDVKQTATLIGQILWPTRLWVMNDICRDLISCLIDAIQLERFPKKMELVNLLQSLVSMAATTLSLPASGEVSSPRLHELSEAACLLARELAYRTHASLEDLASLKLLLTTLRPTWLAFKVSHTLLDLYDDSLMPISHADSSEHHKSLRVLLDHYLHLVPPTETISCPSPHRKRTAPTERPLRTIIDVNHNNTGASTEKSGSVGRRSSRASLTGPGAKGKIANINKRNPKGETALQQACIKNNVHRVRELLAVPGLDVNLPDYGGWTALHEVCNHGNVECLKELLRYRPPRKITSYFKTDSDNLRKVDLRVTSLEEGLTPLHDAVRNDHIDVVRLLLHYGGVGLLDAKTKDGQSVADLSSSEEMTELLEGPLPPPLTDVSGLSESLSFSQGSEMDCSQCSQGGQCNVRVSAKSVQPSDSQYDDIMDGKASVSVSDADKYITLVYHLIKNYLQFYELGSSELSENLVFEDLRTVKHLQTYSRSFKAHLAKICADGYTKNVMLPLNLLVELGV